MCSSCPMACHKSGADRCGADRGRPCAADPGRCTACATGARAESCREADGRCASATDPGGACCRERSSATLVRASGDSTGGRAQIEQIVDVPVPQIWEQSVEVIKVILQEQCQRMRFFFLLTACGEGAVGGTFHTCCPTANSHTPGLILSASDGMFVVSHFREQTTIMTAHSASVSFAK